MTDIDVKADLLLKDTATRQLMVDRLLRRSGWQDFPTRMLPTIAAVAGALFAWSAWGSGGHEASRALVTGALILVFWLSIALVDVVGRVRALTKILERSGALDQFVAESTRN